MCESQVLDGMLVEGAVDGRWKQFMEFQIRRARACFAEAESGIDFLDKDARWPVWYVPLSQNGASWISKPLDPPDLWAGGSAHRLA